jgi:hypothetical protein
MEASPKNTNPKSPKRMGSYHETAKQIQLPIPLANFRLLSIASTLIKNTIGSAYA